MTIDWWTLLLQAVNVLVLVWLLARFFWRPVAKVIADRQAAATALIGHAEARRGEAQRILGEVEAQRAGIAAERQKLLAAARAEADAARAAQLAEAAKEVEATRASATAAIAKEREAAQAEWERQAGRLAVEIARRLLVQLGDGVAEQAFADRLVETLRALPARDRLAVVNGGTDIEAISSAPLGEADRTRIAAAIAEALDARPAIGFSTDPALIAGLELRTPHRVIHNSWRADLDRILTDLDHATAG